MADCQTCLHWRRNDQLPVPDNAPRPFSVFGYNLLADMRSNWERRFDAIHRASVEASNAFGSCRRFPTSKQTAPDFYCGEYAAAPDAEDAETIALLNGAPVEPVADLTACGYPEAWQ
jgi:hypothetical protein